MALYEIGFRTANTAADTCAFEIRSGATGAPRVHEMWITNAGVTNGFGLGVPLARGITPTNIPFLPNNPTDPAALSNVAVAWGTAPTIPLGGAAFIRRFSLKGNAGEGVIWTWPFGYRMLPDRSLALFNTPGGNQCDCFVVLDE